MRYELANLEWSAIKPFLPNKPRGVPRVNDRRVLNGIFWVLRSGAPWRDLPQDPCRSRCQRLASSPWPHRRPGTRQSAVLNQRGAADR